MSLEYSLTYAGIPFLIDQAQVVRMDREPSTQGRDKDSLPPKKHQPLADLIDEINRLIDIMFIYG